MATTSTVVVETAWDDMPDRVVFDGKDGWPAYVPERTCEIVKGKCSNCGDKIDITVAAYCRCCGAKVEVS